MAKRKLTAAQREQRSAAGKKSGAIRGRRTTKAARGRGQLMPDTDREIDETMLAYVARVGPPQSWPDVKIYEQVKAEIIKTSQGRLQLAEERGRLCDRDLVRQSARKMRDEIGRHLELVPKQVADGIELPLDQRAKLAKSVQSAIARALDAAQAAAAK